MSTRGEPWDDGTYWDDGFGWISGEPRRPMIKLRYVNAATAQQAAELGEALLHAIGLPTTERRTAAKTAAYSDPIPTRGNEALVPVLERHLANAPSWVQPTGAHDAYARGRIVIDEGTIWLNLIDANVWQPGVTGWREIPLPGQLPAWVQPTGAHDAYALGALVMHTGRPWRTERAANVWEPGMFDSGWVRAAVEELLLPTGTPTWQTSGASGAPTVAAIQARDEQWIAASANSATVIVRTSMAAPMRPLLGLQDVEAEVRRNASGGSGQPSVTVEVLAAGSNMVLATPISAGMGTEAAAQSFTGTFDPAVLGATSPADVELRVTISPAGGGPNQRSGNLGYLAWLAQGAP